MNKLLCLKINLKNLNQENEDLDKRFSFSTGFKKQMVWSCGVKDLRFIFQDEVEHCRMGSIINVT